MAERNGNGLGGWGNAWRGAVDRILPGSQRGADGRLIGSSVLQGVAGRGASVVGSFFGGPAVGRLISQGAGNLIDTGSVTRYGYGTGPMARFFGRDANSVGDVVREPIGEVRPSGGNLGLGSAPAGLTSGQLYRDPYLGWQQYLAPQGSIDNFGNNNIRTQPAVGGGWQPSSQWGRDMLNGGSDNGAGANRFFSSDQFSAGRGGATAVTDPTAAGAITSWAAGAAMNPGFRAFSRAKK